MPFLKTVKPDLKKVKEKGLTTKRNLDSSMMTSTRKLLDSTTTSMFSKKIPNFLKPTIKSELNKYVKVKKVDKKISFSAT
jgi:predicted DNA-binding protein (UPF0278 family)